MTDAPRPEARAPRGFNDRRARDLAAECVARDPGLTTPGFADAIRATELLASPDWLERN